MKKLFSMIVFAIFGDSAFAKGKLMTQSQMESIVKAISTNVEGGEGVMTFTFDKVQMHLISDVTHNRMRIIAAVARYETLTDAHKHAMLVSNFHRSLDVRYAVSDGIVYSAYIHPLKELTEEQIKSAVRQVSSLAASFGQSYTSGELDFGSRE